MTGRIHSIETLGGRDGPGLRAVVFLQGCPLRCRYCHNPDTWDPGGGREMDVAGVLGRVRRLRPYFGASGGVTLSGGEPLLQAAFAAELLQACRAEGIGTALDTGGGVPWNDAVQRALDAADLVLLDVKATGPAAYRALTGGTPAHPLRIIEHLRQTGRPVWVRQVVIAGYNDTVAAVRRMRAQVAGLNIARVELLPYHGMGIGKWRRLGFRYALESAQAPDDDTMRMLQEAAAVATSEAPAGQGREPPRRQERQGSS